MALEYNRADRYDLTQTLYEMSLELDWMPAVDKKSNKINGGRK